MDRYKKVAITMLCIYGMILLSGCSSSKLVDIWIDPSYHQAPLAKIMIISLRKDPIMRRIWEDAFVGELARVGVRALPSYHLFPEAFPDTNQVFQGVKDNGFDAVLVIRLLDSETKRHYVPGYVISEQQSQLNIFHNRYTLYYHTVNHKGYVETEIIDCRAIELWTVGNAEQIIWSATSNSSEGDSAGEVSVDIANLVTQELARNLIIDKVK